MQRVEIICFAGGTYGVRVGTFATQQEAEGFKRVIEAALESALNEQENAQPDAPCALDPSHPTHIGPCAAYRMEAK